MTKSGIPNNACYYDRCKQALIEAYNKLMDSFKKIGKMFHKYELNLNLASMSPGCGNLSHRNDRVAKIRSHDEIYNII